MRTRNPTNRREFLRLAAVNVVGTAVLAACAPAVSPSPTAVSKAGEAVKPVAPAAQQPVEAPKATATASAKVGATESITYWTLLKRGDSNPRAQAETQIIEAFEQKTKTSVQVEVIPWYELDKKLITATAANTGPDVGRVDPLRFPLHWEANTHIPLDKYLANWSQQDKDDFTLWDYSIKDGQKMSFPTAFTSWLVYYRKDIFEQLKLQPAKSWTEFGELTQKLTVGGERWGFATGLGRSSPYFQIFFFPLVWSGGGEILDRQGKAVYNADQSVKAMQFVSDLVYTYSGMPKETINYTYDDCMQAFMSGKLAMVIEGSHRYNTILSSDTVKGKVGLADVPSWDGQKPAVEPIMGWHLGIARPSKKPDAAWLFIEHYANKDSELIQAKVAGEVPARKSLLADPFMQTPQAAHIRTFAEYMGKYGRPIPRTTHWDELMDGLVLAAHAVINKQKTPKQALDEAAATFNALT